MFFTTNGHARNQSMPGMAEFFDPFPDPCFAIDLHGKVIAWNQALAGLTGIKAENMLGRGDYAYAVPFYGFRRPILIDLVLRWDDEIAGRYGNIEKSGDGLVAQVEIPQFKAHAVHFRIKADKIFNQAGECIGAMEVIRAGAPRNISAHHPEEIEAEKTLILNTVTEMVTYFDLDLRVKWLNHATAHALGRSAGEVIGRHCYEVWHNKSEPCAGCPVVKAKTTGRPQKSEVTTPDGRNWLVRGYPVLDKSGNIISLVEIALEISDRKRIEEQLRQTADSLLEAQKIARIGSWRWDLPSGRVQWSDEMFRILGLPRQEPSYELARSLVHPEDLPFWENSVQSALEKGVFRIDYRAIRPDGKTVWIHNEAVVGRDASGKAIQVTGTAQDISARKAIETELVERERQLRRYSELHRLIARISTRFSHAGAAKLNLYIDETLEETGLFIGVDRSYLFQFSDDLATASNTHEWCAPGIRPEMPNLQDVPCAPMQWTMARLGRGESIAINSVVDLPPQARTEKDFYQAQDIRALLLVPVSDDQRLFGFLGFDSVQGEKEWAGEDLLVLRTVSEVVGNALVRIRKEKMLRQSEEQHRLALDATQLGTWKYDLATQELSIDERSRELFGLPVNQAIDMNRFRRMVHPEDLGRVVAAMQETVDPSRETRSVKVQYRIVRPDGEMRWIQGTGKAFFQRSGAERKAVQVIGTHMDVTRHKLYEQMLHRMNDHLEQQVAERTAELEKRNKEIKALAHKTILAMENDRKVFSKELHDSIGGTLAAIKFQLEHRLSTMGTPPAGVSMPYEKIVEYLSTAITESRRITKQLRPSVLDDLGLIAAIRECVRDFAAFHPEIKVLLRVSILEADISSDLQTIIYRLLQEALNNVGKHSRANEVFIQCRRFRNWVRLKIRDNGCGFDLSQFCMPGPNLEGYGLQSMRERVEICNGRFSIQSAPGKGTQVIAAVPLYPTV